MSRLAEFSSDHVKEAICRIVLRDGAAGLSLPAVARELGVPLRTAQRRLRSAQRLPSIALRQIEHDYTTDFYARWRRRRPMDDRLAMCLEFVLDEIPHTPRELHDAIVWHRLVSALATHHDGVDHWVGRRNARRTSFVDDTVDELATLDPELDASFERSRLRAILDGAIALVTGGQLDAPSATATVRGHVQSLAPAEWRAVCR